MLVSSLDKQYYGPRVYVVAETDKMSAKRALTREQEWAAAAQVRVLVCTHRCPQLQTAPIPPKACHIASHMHTSACCDMCAACSKQYQLLTWPFLHAPHVQAQLSSSSQHSDQSHKQNKAAKAAAASTQVSVEVIPRSREVGQSYVTSVFTTLYSLLWAFWMVTRHRPQMVRTVATIFN